MTTKSGLQSRQQRQTLFAQRGQITTNASKGLSESLAAEAAGDFLLHLDHPKISLSEIIVKIHPQILQEVEDGFLMFAQAIEQTEKLRFPVNDFLWIYTAFPQLTRLFCRLFHIQQEGFEVCCPWDALF